MAYRNGTYVAFHAEGNPDSSQSDMRYYRMLCAWHANDDFEFNMIDSHAKTAQVRDSSSRETLRTRLRERLNNSRNMVLIIGDRTRFDNDWVPEEIAYAIDQCKIPIIAAYPGYDFIIQPTALRGLWPTALTTRIDNDTARVIHVPFKQVPLDAAIKQFDHNNMPQWCNTHYTVDAYKGWGINAA
jgi:hypothetical protein